MERSDILMLEITNEFQKESIEILFERKQIPESPSLFLWIGDNNYSFFFARKDIDISNYAFSRNNSSSSFLFPYLSSSYNKLSFGNKNVQMEQRRTLLDLYNGNGFLYNFLPKGVRKKIPLFVCLRRNLIERLSE